MVEHRSPEPLDVADANSPEPPLSEAELTALALRDPPPGELAGSEAKQESPLSERSGTGIFWLIGFLVIGVVGALFAYSPKTESHEVARQRSPDGVGDAVLMEFTHDAAGLHSYRVCMQRPSGGKVAPNNCREVAYLGGVSTDGRSQPVMLVWPTPSQLEIRYGNATSVHVYQPVFTWGSTRSANRAGSIRAILIKAVQTRE